MRRSAHSRASSSIRRHRIRCAIYTRKSTEEGLDQDFNSLDAQREACAAYVQSQRHEGWALLPGAYDDGGFSGGNMERPGLQRLLADVRAGKVDVIVVYKVDRLTRSLTDFAKIVEVLDRAGASFVSVTQAFNTTTSMGRLTLNVLLSFAQFEREVIAERVRDKVAASKAKGMWMGGHVPLGYDVKDRKLAINQGEAEIVRHILRRYCELGSVRALMADLKVLGIRTKQQRLRDGRIRGGVPFARGPLYHLLKNRLYVGEIAYRDQVYPGEHQPIVDHALFDRVQALLATNAAERHGGGQAAHPSMLAGMIRDGQDRPMSPSHANKPAVGIQASRRYRYYVSNEAVPVEGASATRTMRLPAIDTEHAVIEGVSATLEQATPFREHWLSLSGCAAQQAERRGQDLALQLRQANATEARGLLQQIDFQMIVEEEGIVASMSLARLAELIELEVDGIDLGARVPVSIPTSIRRRGQELRLKFEPQAHRPGQRDRYLIGLLARAHQAHRQLIAMGDRDAIGHRRELARLARLSYLAPDISAAILDGRHPADLSARRLLRIGDLPLSWIEQRYRLGFI